MMKKRRFKLLSPLLILLGIAGVRWFNQSREKTQQVMHTGKQTARQAEDIQTMDDLTEIEGIGPKSADVLHKAGVHTFAHLAKTDPEQLKVILREAGMPSIRPDTWPEQARLAKKGDWEGLYALRDELRGGRRV